MLKYVIYADEAWTQTKPLYRYHCFFGGFISTSSEFDNLEKEVKKLKKEYKYTKEIKWANISNQDIDFYNQLIDLIFQFLKNLKIVNIDSFLWIELGLMLVSPVLILKHNSKFTINL
ncbi:hypothetical protein MNL90_19435 [Acinetobacter baumannii]|uniref:hypothetical protein n=1 Tax=Acinetobacter baumannii TaxID=470 RepID=UPI00223A8352|nr:hypothetical protein [Acinetobacter baumannii]MCT2433039.1 hypothetical protein [Acinetobacter baumannii]